MATPFQLDILTPERSFFSGSAEGITVETPDGEITVMAHHVPLVTPLEIGRIRLQLDGVWKEAFISEGFMEVGRSGTVIVTQACEWPEKIDVRRAEAVMQRMLEREQHQTDLLEHKSNQITLARAMARLRVTRSQNLK